MNLSQKFYADFQYAFNFFNKELFKNQLESCLISIRAKANSAGYFAPERFVGEQEKYIHEIAINPNILNKDNGYIFSTLVHEMVHLWQKEYGKPGKNQYHNKEFANKMMAVGLMPSSTGRPEGKTTGQHMSDYPIPNGIFLKTLDKLIAHRTFNFFWENLNPKKPGVNSKVKFTCMRCGQNAWGKVTLQIKCLFCDKTMKSVDYSDE